MPTGMFKLTVTVTVTRVGGNGNGNGNGDCNGIRLWLQHHLKQCSEH